MLAREVIVLLGHRYLRARSRHAQAIRGRVELPTFRFSEGLSWPGAPGAVSSVTLSCLHKGVPGLTRPC